MAAVVYPTPCKLYLGAITAVTGGSGTELKGIEARDIVFMLDGDVRLRRNGLGPSAGLRAYHGRYQSARLIVPLRNQSATALKILYSHLTTDGSTFRPNGGTAAAEFTPLPTFALILRPDKTTEKYLYSPNWALAPESLWAVRNSDEHPQQSLSQLEMIATRPTNATGPAYAWGLSAAIASAFSITE